MYIIPHHSVSPAILQEIFFYFPELLDQAGGADLLQPSDEIVGAVWGISSICAVPAPWTVPANFHHHSSLHS